MRERDRAQRGCFHFHEFDAEGCWYIIHLEHTIQRSSDFLKIFKTPTAKFGVILFSFYLGESIDNIYVLHDFSALQLL